MYLTYLYCTYGVLAYGTILSNSEPLGGAVLASEASQLRKVE